MLATAALLTLLAALPTHAVVDVRHDRFVSIFPIVAGRIDPIVAPGKVSAHTHIIYGANNIRDVLNTPEEQSRATCTSATISADKSLYWMPMPYFINPDNTYTPLAPRNARAYYQMIGNPQPFPPGFRMISGHPMKRDESSPDVAGLEFAFACAHGNAERFYLPNGSSYSDCEHLQMQVTFPSCGLADQTLDSDSHSSHVTFPIESDGEGKARMKAFQGGRCPESHPIKYPIIQFEAIFSLTPEMRAQWRTDGSPNFILANGDTVGSTLHADFVNGWDEGALEKLMYDCADQPGNSAEECPSLKEFVKVNDAENCRFAGMLPDEDVGFGKPLEQMKGCNPRWDADVPTKPGCECTPPDPGWVGPNGVLRINGHAMEAIPVAIDVGGGDIAEVVPSLGAFARFEDWKAQTWWFRDEGGPNKDQWMTSSPEDIARNLVGSTEGADTVPEVYGMQDTAEFGSRKASGTVPPEGEWMTTKIVPQPTCTSNGLVPC